MKIKDTKEKNIISTSRIQALVDAVFAIAMTLLILNVDVPELSSFNAGQVLGEKIINMLPIFYNFTLSFILLGIFWIMHHKQFLIIKKSNQKLLWINLFLLLSIVMIPFSSELVGDYGNTRTAALFFNANLFLASMIYLWQWLYATTNHRLIDKDISIKYIHYGTMKNLMFPVVSFCAIVLGLFKPALSLNLYIAIPFILFWVENKYKN